VTAGAEAAGRGRRPPVALTIAGSDSGGGAGIQADLKTFHAFGVFGTSAITAVTAQNTRGVVGFETLSPGLVRDQVRAVCDDLEPAACKSGMLGNASVVRAVAEVLDEVAIPAYVLDPVMVAQSGDPLLEDEAVEVIRSELLPRADLVTPNLDEAALLAGRPVEAEDDFAPAARALLDAGAGAALIKGGHMEGDEVVDVLFDGDGRREWRGERIRTRNTHGTGCTLSSAVAAGLAAGGEMADAVDAAIAFARKAIAAAPDLGGGAGPLNHWAPVPDG
jgi:hydroxymethylpyrimidine/phosphomethylpyrimidine kinase